MDIRGDLGTIGSFTFTALLAVHLRDHKVPYKILLHG